MLDDFINRAVLAAVGTALATGLLGCFVVWRRMAYFGDATAHAAILGVALSLAFSVSIFAGVLAVSLAVALLVFALSGRGVAMDTLLGVVSHGALALGLVAVSLVPGTRLDLDAYLFGDVLLVSVENLAVIWGGAVIVTAVLVRNWAALLTATLSPDLAFAADINPRREQLILTLLLAMVVALSIKVVGALLITALLIVPAAAARGIARTPEGMAALGGMALSLRFETPAGPSIVCVAVAFFAINTVGARIRA
jgi:zinc transport system permease protein